MVSFPITDPAHAGQAKLQLERVLNSGAFRKAPGLRHLLEYLVTRSTEGHAEQIKESVLAVEVFGRRANFDGRIDNIVRVQAHRLRKLLDAYYLDEGKADKLRFCIPRGSYVPQLVALEDGDAEAATSEDLLALPAVTLESSTTLATDFDVSATDLPPEPDAPQQAPHQQDTPRPWASKRLILSVAAAFAAGLLVAFLVMTLTRPRTPQSVQMPAAIVEIWNGIFEPDAHVIVSYTNPVFLRVEKSKTYLMYGGPISAPPGTEISVKDNDPNIDWQSVHKGQHLFFNDGWTGTGEVLAVNRLTELGAQFNDRINVIPSRTLALNEMHGANVIFLGSPWLNGALAQISSAPAPIYNTNDGRIVIRNPLAGEQAQYENIKDPTTGQIQACYALFSVMPGMDDGRRVVSSAGIGTWATWAGIDFVTSPAGAAQLTKSLKASNGGVMPLYYQAIIRTYIIKETASNHSLVVTRIFKPAAAGRSGQ
jgi:hypothetical protein